MAVRRITKTLVDRLGPGETIWDEEVRGFGVRRQTRDAVFVLKTRVGGRQRFFTIGRHGSPWTVESGRAKARSLLGAIADGKDPAAERDGKARDPAVADMVRLFLEEHVRPKRKRTTASSYEHILRSFVVPALGGKPAMQVTAGEVARLHSSMRDKPYQANRMLAVLSAMYSWAARELIPKGHNPAANIEPYKEHRRERFLTSDELARLGIALREAETTGIPWEPDSTKKSKHAAKPENRVTVVSPYATAAIRLLLFTGARLREVLHLQWEHVDLERGLLLIPDSKTGRKAIILNGPATAVIASLPRAGPLVIAGTSPERPRSDLKRPWLLVSRRAGLENVRIHDLRHSFASVGAGSGLGLPVIGKLLGHTQASTTARYAHLDNDPVRRAAEAIGVQISNALSRRSAEEGS